MIDILSDIITFLKINKIQSKIKFCFFVENNFIYQYLEPYIQNKKSKNTIIISLENLNINKPEKKVYVLKTIFFRNLFFLTHKIRFLISSTPDLDNSFFKRSKYNLTKYIYIQHSPLSLTKIYDEKAFLAFDAVQVVNIFQKKELMKINYLHKKKIKAFKSKYLFLDKKISQDASSTKKKVLIAPTWHTNFYELNLHVKLKEILDEKKIDYVLRPHPMSLKKKEISIEKLKKDLINFDIDNELNFKNFSYLISDWSGIYVEFSIINKKFSFLINTKQKIRNINSNKFSEVPLEVFARNILGSTIEIENLAQLNNLLEKKNLDNNSKITKFYNDYFY